MNRMEKNTMKKNLVSGLVLASWLLAGTACSVFNPNFLVGTWVGSNLQGEVHMTFAHNSAFTARYLDENRQQVTVEGTYSAGPSVLQLSFDGEKRFASYTMYSNNIDLVWNNSLIRLGRFK